jgi:LmbE family N-acetylglucosaminyl deacetylase
MIESAFPDLREVLCLGAHADDIEIGCGGTLLKLVRMHPGLRIRFVVFSAEGTRIDEAEQSAQRLLSDAGELRFEQHAFRDSFFPYQGEAIKEVFHTLAGTCSPGLILTHRHKDAHQDHRTLSDLTWCAFRDHTILEYEVPKFEGDLGRPNLYARLTDAEAEQKIAHLARAFPSQSGKPWYDERTFRALLRIRGLECHAPSGYAEGLYARKLVL